MQRVRRLRDHGRSGKYEHVELGWGYRLDAIQAAILAAKLPHLEEWTEQRRAAARRYDVLLADSGVIAPVERPHNRHVYHCYAIRSPQRDALVAHLTREGIGVVIHYPLPMHLQPVYEPMGLERGSFPVAEAAAEQVVSLPLYAEITAQQQDRVVRAIKAFRKSVGGS
jgi:dTDP-4-amino-4,6-dideoxygalactose transaminase